MNTEQFGKIFELSPLDIRVNKDLSRFREEMGDVKGLAESIKKYGQLLPVLITENKELIAGGRRLAACIFLNYPVKCVYRKDIDHLLRREIEIEENFQRKDFTPAEYAKAVNEIHNIKVTKFGQGDSGSKLGWSMEKTAKYLGISKGNVHRQIETAKIVEQFPELAKGKTTMKILSDAKIIKQKALREHTALKLKDVDFSKLVYTGDSLVKLKELEEKTFDLLLTDPPYGIDIVDRMNSTKTVFNDSFNEDLFRILACESFRICKDDAFAVIFCAPEYFSTLYKTFQSAGWIAYARPLIWYKTTGSTNCARLYPHARYEMALLCRKGNIELKYQDRSDVMQLPSLHGSNKAHLTEKPIDLFRYLITWLVLPGARIIDPFMGSGNSLIAALLEKCIPYGGDALEENVNIFKDNLTKLISFLKV